MTIDDATFAALSTLPTEDLQQIIVRIAHNLRDRAHSYTRGEISQSELIAYAFATNAALAEIPPGNGMTRDDVKAMLGAFASVVAEALA